MNCCNSLQVSHKISTKSRYFVDLLLTSHRDLVAFSDFICYKLLKNSYKLQQSVTSSKLPKYT